MSHNHTTASQVVHQTALGPDPKRPRHLVSRLPSPVSRLPFVSRLPSPVSRFSFVSRFWFVALFAIGHAPANAQGQLPTDRIDSVFSEMNRSNRPGCTLGVFQGGDVAYTAAYGMANLEYGIALHPQSVFHVASISKQFTAFAVELLVADGEVNWDDDIRTYVPEIPEYGDKITLRHLAHHTSGIRDQWNLLFMAGWRWEADLVTQGNAIDVMSRQKALNFRPGDEYLYSNSGFTLLAVVVERVTGKTLREFAHERIFAPLGMTNTHFHDDFQFVVPNRAYGYRHFDDEGWKISIPDFSIVGASSLFTTVADMAKWDRSLRDRELGDAALYERFLDRGVLTNGDTITYAHGIAVNTYRGQRTIGHGGADAGYRTNYIRFPDADLGVVSFCNFARANPGAYVRRTADIILEGVLEPATEEDEPSIDTGQWGSTFETISGFYRDPLSDIPLHVWTNEGRARAIFGFGSDNRGLLMVPIGGNVFEVRGANQTLTLEMDGRVPRVLRAERRAYEYIGPHSTDFNAADYTGTYWSDEVGTEYRIEPDSNDASRLAMLHRKQRADSFAPVYRDGFWSGGDWLTFHRDGTGRVDGFTWSNGRVRKVVFTRRP